MNIDGTTLGEALFGTSSADSMFGFDGNDTLSGFDGSDHLDGGRGADTMTGGRGSGTYVVDDLGDRAIEALGEGRDKVPAFVSWALPANVEDSLLQAAPLAAVGIGNAVTGGTTSRLVAEER